MLPAARTFPDIASGIALGLLLVPVVLAVVRRAADRLDPVEAVALGLGAIATLLVLGGVLLAALDALHTAGWLAVVGVADSIALLSMVDRARVARRALVAGLGALAVALAVGAVALSRASAVDHAHKTRFTQLWFLPTPPNHAVVGVRNEERRTMTFRLKVFGPGGTPLIVNRSIRLGAGRTFGEVIAPPRTRRPVRINAEIYRPGVTAPYRATHLWTAQSAGRS